MCKKNTKRFRIFAGANGSGKTTLFRYLKEKGYIKTELYISADRIEKDLILNNRFVFNAYRVTSSYDDFAEYIDNHGLSKYVPRVRNGNGFQLSGGILTVEKEYINSYFAAFVAGYLVDKLFLSGQSFCYETVLSHKSKIDLLPKAKSYSYKTYVYYVYTDLVELNIERVNLRYKEGGHNVPEDKIRTRYERSKALIPQIISNTDNFYFLDNSYNDYKLLYEKRGKKVKNYNEFYIDSIY